MLLKQKLPIDDEEEEGGQKKKENNWELENKAFDCFCFVDGRENHDFVEKGCWCLGRGSWNNCHKPLSILYIHHI